MLSLNQFTHRAKPEFFFSYVNLRGSCYLLGHAFMQVCAPIFIGIENRRRPCAVFASKVKGSKGDVTNISWQKIGQQPAASPLSIGMHKNYLEAHRS